MIDYSDTVARTKPSIAFISVMQGGSFKAQGSGFIFYKSGTLVTCNHVVEDPIDRILLLFPDMAAGSFIEAKVVSRNIKHDLAILEFQDPEKRPPLELCKKEVREGMPVIFLGYPLGLRTITTHQGILSSVAVDATGIQTYLIDGTVNQGNSGCPLLNPEGEVIGVVTATKREDKDLLDGVSDMKTGVISLHGVDLIEIYQALIKNLQLGIGYAVPCAYIPKG